MSRGVVGNADKRVCLGSKLNGLKHVWVHFAGDVPTDMKLYQPYTNNNCLHCHDDARSYVDLPEHREKLKALAEDKESCLSCHEVVHDKAAVKEGRFWLPEGP